MGRLSLNIISIVILATTLLAASCRGRVVAEAHKTFGETGWHQDSSGAFDLVIPDTTSTYKILLTITNNDDYPFTNLYLFANITFPSGKIIRDTMELILADPRGKWTGGAWLGDYSNTFPYRSNIRFPEPGTYSFTIWQAMRCPNKHLQGIKSYKFSVLSY